MDSFNNFDDGQILEGFLCPICREDLKTPERLTDHVEKVHAEDQDVLKSLKEIFSLAKRKIKINFDETELAKAVDNSLKINSFSSTSSQFNVFKYMKQDVGVDCSHYSSFCAIRNPRLDRYASETNKLLIRLSKLLKNRPSDPVQQKLHDQKTVPWLDGKTVKLCPVCAKSFHIARRQHHCRLCGSIMCNDCSQFLPLSEASNLISVSSLDSDKQLNESVLAKSENENCIRSCDHCLRLLDNRKEMQDSRTSRPEITIIYSEIEKLKNDINPDVEMYLKMVNSLYEGESIYTLNDVSTLRGKIGHAAELIDIKSKRILALKCLEGTREEALKKAVRLACIQYIKDKMLTLPQLPVEETITELQQKRRHETEQRIERERRLAMEAYEKYGLVNESSSASPSKENFTSRSAITTIDNWSGHQNATISGLGSDPLIEQVNIIKGYIKQARAAMRYDEIETLELNLRELQNEIYHRQQQ